MQKARKHATCIQTALQYKRIDLCKSEIFDPEIEINVFDGFI